MKTLLAALAAAVLLSRAAPAAAGSKAKEQWTHAKSGRSVSGTAAHHSATVRPASNASGGRGFSSPSYASSSLPSYGGSHVAGPSRAGSVQPLRPMARSRTSGGGAFVAGGAAQGHTYTTVQASPAAASASTAGGGSKIQMGKGGRSIGGPGITMGDADTPPGGANNSANGNDPLSKIMAGLGNMFGDMAKSMSAMWGGGG